MRISLAGRRAVVTGGASGIGLAAAQALSDCGADVVVLDRDRAGLARTGEAHGFRGRVLDVSDGAAVAAAAQEIGATDILVNAAGNLQRPLPLDEIPEREWDRTIAVHLKGTYLACRAFGPAMAARGGGCIVNVTSVMGMRSTPLHAYGPAKAAIASLTEGLAAELGPSGVRVNAVAPGFTETPALDKAVHFGVLDPATLARQAPLGRLVRADEVGAAIAFLVSDLAGAITGVTLAVDAGFLTAGSWGAFGGLPAAARRRDDEPAG